MREPSSTRTGRFGKGPRKRVGRKGRYSDGNRVDGTVNGNTFRNASGNHGETSICIKCGHPAPDGKLCSFHRLLLNTFRKEIPEQDPRRFRM